MTQTPADELRSAAEKLRRLATAISAPDPKNQPFHADGCDVTQGRYPGLYDVATTQTPELADHIAAMGPLVGSALADWLDETARNAERFGEINARALAVARALNGQP